MPKKNDLPLITPMVIKPILEKLKGWLCERQHIIAPLIHVGYEAGGCPTCGHDSIYKNVLDFDALCKEIDAFGEGLRSTRSSED